MWKKNFWLKKILTLELVLQQSRSTATRLVNFTKSGDWMMRGSLGWQLFKEVDDWLRRPVVCDKQFHHKIRLDWLVVSSFLISYLFIQIVLIWDVMFPSPYLIIGNVCFLKGRKQIFVRTWSFYPIFAGALRNVV